MRNNEDKYLSGEGHISLMRFSQIIMALWNGLNGKGNKFVSYIEADPYVLLWGEFPSITVGEGSNPVKK